MSVRVPTRLARHVRERAGNVCEYCRLPQAFQEATFHIDHVAPRASSGATTLENLALACVSFSLRKAARIEARDPKTGRVVALFNPRIQDWSEHFIANRKMRIGGRTPTGRATIGALAMNRAAAIAIRQELARLGQFNVEF
jgi:hypothetical protein